MPHPRSASRSPLRTALLRLVALVLLLVTIFSLDPITPTADAAPNCDGCGTCFANSPMLHPKPDFGRQSQQSTVNTPPRARPHQTPRRQGKAFSRRQSATLSRGKATLSLPTPGDENWDSSFNTQGMDDVVVGVAFNSSGILYAGGCFLNAGTTPANRIAAWDGSAWSALGNGLNDVVEVVGVDNNGNVYAGGDFTGICDDAACTTSTAANHIAMWDGTTWHALANGLNDTPLSFAFDSSNNVYAGGDFFETCADTACIDGTGTSVNGIVKWNGTAFSALASGFDNSVEAVQFDHAGNLFAGGDFIEACADSACVDGTGTIVNAIAEWSDSAWVPVGFGFDDTVIALAVDSHDQLYAAGDFYSACGDAACSCGCSGTPVYAIARWDGTSWNALAGGLDLSGTIPEVIGLTVDSADNVYPSGAFDAACADDACNDFVDTFGIAKWDGTAWSALGSGLDFFGFRDTYSGANTGNTGKLFVGGLFSAAGANPSLFIAQWTAAAGQAITGTGKYTFYSNNLPITINVTDVKTLARINIQRDNESHPNGGPTFDSYFWTIEGLDKTGSPTTGFTLNLTLPTTYSPDASSAVCRFSGAVWDCGADSFTSNSITRNGLHELSPWATSSDTTTAANIANFHGKLGKAGKVALHWQSTTEAEISGFNVYRAGPQGNFKKINPHFLTAQAPGNPLGSKYSFKDKTARSGKTYRYKIQVILTDTTSQWSDIITMHPK